MTPYIAMSRVERIEAFRLAWNAGKTAADIAALHGCTRNTVLGLVNRARNAGDTGFAERDSGHSSPTDPVVLDRLRRMYTMGLTYQVIAEKLGVSINVAAHLVRQQRRLGDADFAPRAAELTIRPPRRTAYGARRTVARRASVDYSRKFVCTDAPLPASRVVSLEDLGLGDCKWMTSATEYCGAPVHKRSFCIGHYAMAYLGGGK